MQTEQTSSDSPTDLPKNKENTLSMKETIKELVRFALIALLIIVPIRVFIAQPFIVSGSSMVPTFQNGQYLIVDEISYRLGEPKRGDVVVFRYPNDTKKFFIKRIIGLPGETIDIKKGETTIINTVHPEGLALDQSFIQNHSTENAHTTLGSDQYFVMGDNRTGSFDSRSWGPVSRNLLVGRAYVRLFPINKISFMPGDYYK